MLKRMSDREIYQTCIFPSNMHISNQPLVSLCYTYCDTLISEYPCCDGVAGISRTQDPASRDEKIWVRTHAFAKRRFHGRKVFSP